MLPVAHAVNRLSKDFWTDIVCPPRICQQKIMTSRDTSTVGGREGSKSETCAMRSQCNCGGSADDSNTLKRSPSYNWRCCSRFIMIAEEGRKKWYVQKILDLTEASAGTDLDLGL